MIPLAADDITAARPRGGCPTRSVGVRLPLPLWQRLELAAGPEGLSSILRVALAEHLERVAEGRGHGSH